MSNDIVVVVERPADSFDGEVPKESVCETPQLTGPVRRLARPHSL